MENSDYYSQDGFALEEVQRKFMTKVYGWMAFALAITGIVSYYVSLNDNLVRMIYGNRIIFWGLIIGELALVMWLSAGIQKMKPQLATILFVAYSIFNGLTLSLIFRIYTTATIYLAFFTTAGTFLAMTLFGLLTKRDLSSWGRILFMALIGIIIASVLNWFLNSPGLYYAISYIGVAVFTGLVAYDTQRLKQMATQVEEGSSQERKAAIIGALKLYLDFINLFLFILRIFGRRR